MKKFQLPQDQIIELIKTLKNRFEKNIHRHHSLKWDDVLKKLENNQQKLWSLYEMELT